MSESTITERLAAARRRARDARIAARAAANVERDLELEEATQHARAKLDEALAGGDLSSELHGELVASAAREHGAASARAGSIQDVTWRHLRVALASLVGRVQGAEGELDRLRGCIEAAGEVISEVGCECVCDHAAAHEDHDDDCEPCHLCRIADALQPEYRR